MKMSEKSLNFMETVCQKLDDDRHMTLIEYAQDCGIDKRNAYTLLMKAVGNDRKRYMQYLQRPYLSRKKNNTSAQTTNMPTGMNVNTKEEVTTVAEKKKISSANLIILKKKGCTLEEVAVELGYESVEEFLEYLQKTNMSQKARNGLLNEFKANSKRNEKFKKKSKKQIAKETEQTESEDASDVKTDSIAQDVQTVEPEVDAENADCTAETEEPVNSSENLIKQLEDDAQFCREYVASLKEDAKKVASELINLDEEEQYVVSLDDFLQRLSGLRNEIKVNLENLGEIKKKLDKLKKVYLVVDSTTEFSEPYGEIYYYDSMKVTDNAKFLNVFNSMVMNDSMETYTLRQVKKLSKIATIKSELETKHKKEVTLIASDELKTLLADY